MSVRLSACPPVCSPHAGITSKQLNISSNFFTTMVATSHTMLVFPYQTLCKYSDGDPLTNAKGLRKMRFSTNISLYLGKNTRCDHSYHGMRIRNCTQAFEWYHFNDPKWSRTQISRSRHYLTLNIYGRRYRHSHNGIPIRTSHTLLKCVISSDLEWFIEIFNDMMHRAVSPRQLNFLYN